MKAEAGEAPAAGVWVRVWHAGRPLCTHASESARIPCLRRVAVDALKASRVAVDGSCQTNSMLQYVSTVCASAIAEALRPVLPIGIAIHHEVHRIRLLTLQRFQCCNTGVSP